MTHLVALQEAPAEVPQETIHDWHLELGQEIPEAIKYYVYTHSEGLKVTPPISCCALLPDFHYASLTA
jgi:carbonic anhydrase